MKGQRDYSKIRKWETDIMNNNLDNKMYLLYHKYEYGEENEHEEIKILGIYNLKQEASKAIERYYKLVGFREYPKECFIVDEYIVDVDTNWKEGFVNSVGLDWNFEILTTCFNEWLGNNKSPCESWKDEGYYNALCSVYKVVYKIKDVKELAEYIQQIWMKNLGDKSKSFDDYMEIASAIISKEFYDW